MVYCVKLAFHCEKQFGLSMQNGQLRNRYSAKINKNTQVLNTHNLINTAKSISMLTSLELLQVRPSPKK